MRVLGKFAIAVVGMFLGLMFFAMISPDVNQPGAIMAFGGFGAVAGLLVLPRALAWVNAAFEDPPKSDDEADP